METKDNKATSISCPKCGNAAKRFGRHRNGLQRFRCLSCKKTFTEDHQAPFQVGDYLKDARGQMAIRMLVEGCSVRTVERLTGIRRDSIIALLLIAGQRCEKLMDSLRNVSATDIQMDEAWNFIYCKEAHREGTAREDDETIGDCYNWVAIDRPTKMVLAFVCGKRTGENAMELARKVRRVTNPNVRFQLITDGLQSYIAAVDEMLLDRCDFAQLVKVYAAPCEGEHRYSPADCVGATPVVISGNPDPAKICTSHVERQNLTMRMQIRRMTRLTNGFSKKIENHRAAVALHFGFYNFCQLHGSLRVTPAMEAGITDHVCDVNELLTFGS
jgi:transposase-like protein/IS1 family transposase